LYDSTSGIDSISDSGSISGSFTSRPYMNWYPIWYCSFNTWSRQLNNSDISFRYMTEATVRPIKRVTEYLVYLPVNLLIIPTVNLVHWTTYQNKRWVRPLRFFNQVELSLNFVDSSRQMKKIILIWTRRYLTREIRTQIQLAQVTQFVQTSQFVGRFRTLF